MKEAGAGGVESTSENNAYSKILHGLILAEPWYANVSPMLAAEHLRYWM